jgi:hypothetical protein
MAPAAALRAISGAGQPLDSPSRAAFEPGLGLDLGGVRIHTDGEAGRAARDLGALAYAVGQHIAFAPNRYRPKTAEGRRLLAHEVTHTVQQRGVARPGPQAQVPVAAHDSAGEREARVAGSLLGLVGVDPATRSGVAQLSMADPDAVGRVAALGRSQGTGLQFTPTNITDTVVGPPPRGGGLHGDRQNRLNVVIGENLTPRLLARALLPLFITATPFTPNGAAAPVPLQIIDEDTLARGLLTYNAHYLPLPAMTKWRSGLRFPLPIEIDETTGVATLHPSVIASMATGFDPANEPLLDQRAGGLAAPDPAQLLAQAQQFLVDRPTAMDRGYSMAARAITNAPAERPFIDEVFNQLGAGGFEEALEFMNMLVNRQVSILAAQTEGVAILQAIQAQLARAPASPSADQQAALTRANHMLGLVAAAPAVAAPGAMRTRPQRTLTIDMLRLDGSHHNPSTQLAVANAVYAQCNVRLVVGVNATATPADSQTWLGANLQLVPGPHCGALSAEERNLYQTARAQHGLGGGDFMAYFIQNTEGSDTGGLTCDTTAGVHVSKRRVSLIHDSGSTDTLAHELGHHLITRAQSDDHNAPGSPMQGRPRLTLTFLPVECDQIYARARP